MSKMPYREVISNTNIISTSIVVQGVIVLLASGFMLQKGADSDDYAIRILDFWKLDTSYDIAFGLALITGVFAIVQIAIGLLKIGEQVKFGIFSLVLSTCFISSLGCFITCLSEGIRGETRADAYIGLIGCNWILIPILLAFQACEKPEYEMTDK